MNDEDKTSGETANENQDGRELAGHEVKQRPIRKYTVPPQGILEAYSNYINVNWGIFDMRIRFGQLVPVSGESETPNTAPERVVEERVAVTLAWGEVRVLADLLNDSLKKYEEANGEMPKIPKLA
jgi:Protein of unknown function (DUF3467)